MADIDDLLTSLERGVQKVDGSQGSRVKLQLAEKDLLHLFGQARNVLESNLKCNRSRLHENFGGSCDRIARMRAVIDAAKLSPASAEDPRNVELRGRCKSVENVLMVSGCGPDLQKSVLQQKESLWKKLTHLPLQIRIVNYWKLKTASGLVAAAAAEAAAVNNPCSEDTDDGPTALTTVAVSAKGTEGDSEQLQADLEALARVVARIEAATARLVPATPGQMVPPALTTFDFQRVSSSELIEQFAALEYAVTRVELAADIFVSHATGELESVPSEAG